MNNRGYILKHLVFNPETQTTKYYHFTGEEYKKIGRKDRMRSYPCYYKSIIIDSYKVFKRQNSGNRYTSQSF